VKVSSRYSSDGFLSVWYHHGTDSGNFHKTFNPCIAEWHNAECCYAECHYVECRGAYGIGKHVLYRICISLIWKEPFEEFKIQIYQTEAEENLQKICITVTVLKDVQHPNEILNTVHA